MPERALALQVVLGGRHLADAGYHDGPGSAAAGGAVTGMNASFRVPVGGRLARSARNGLTIRDFALSERAVLSIDSRLYSLGMDPASVSLHRWATAFSTRCGFGRGNSVQGRGSKAGTGRDRIEWGPIAGAERTVR